MHPLSPKSQRKGRGQIFIVDKWDVVNNKDLTLGPMPYYKLKCIKQATKELLEREKSQLSECEYYERKEKYETLIKFIEFRTFTIIYLIRNFNNKKAINFDPLKEDLIKRNM